MNIADTSTALKALTIASLTAMSVFAFGAHSAPQASPIPEVAATSVQTVIISAKRLTPAEKVRMDEIESLLSTQIAPLPKKHFRTLT
ncbi:hypothetical protein [Undibacterium sp.]|uniref:hypothetical protein n=1 Tax=Undibacterium sp. TaxID=1914977 RepID=UPI00374D2D0D